MSMDQTIGKTEEKRTALVELLKNSELLFALVLAGCTSQDEFTAKSFGLKVSHISLFLS